ncbi:hypothetical protein [Oceanobacillus senegalensis]|uniref:hypothetical protein n=1 Tax=Oceanobacillus senegalensis TaxID=1936063 RepID=UPI000A30ED69|nr:hypothetical protein [Oceanobacillus senegalensis]
MESLSGGFLIFFIVLLALILVSGLVYWVIRRFSGFAAPAIILPLLLPLVSLVYTAQRESGNAFSYLKSQFAAADWVAVLLIIGYAYIATWFFVVVADLLVKLYRYPPVNKKCLEMWEKIQPHWNKTANYIKSRTDIVKEKYREMVKIIKRKLPFKKQSDQEA